MTGQVSLRLGSQKDALEVNFSRYIVDYVSIHLFKTCLIRVYLVTKQYQSSALSLTTFVFSVHIYLGVFKSFFLMCDSYIFKSLDLFHLVILLKWLIFSIKCCKCHYTNKSVSLNKYLFRWIIEGILAKLAYLYVLSN